MVIYLKVVSCLIVLKNKYNYYMFIRTGVPVAVIYAYVKGNTGEEFRDQAQAPWLTNGLYE